MIVPKHYILVGACQPMKSDLQTILRCVGLFRTGGKLGLQTRSISDATCFSFRRPVAKRGGTPATSERGRQRLMMMES